MQHHFSAERLGCGLNRNASAQQAEATFTPKYAAGVPFQVVLLLKSQETTQNNTKHISS
jgi:hypothetical protein